MGFEPPFPLSPAERPPQLPKPRVKEELPELSLVQEEDLRHGVKFLERELTRCWSTDEMDKGYDLGIELYQHLLGDPQYIRQALRHKETRHTALSIINLIKGFIINWDVKDHFSERDLSDDQKLIILLNDAVIEEEKEIETDLKDEKNDSRGLSMCLISDMLDSPLVEQREYAETKVVAHLSLLQDLLARELDNESISHIAMAWHNILLYISNEKIFKVWPTLQEAWDKNVDKNWNVFYQKLIHPVLMKNSPALDTRIMIISALASNLAGVNGAELIQRWKMVGGKKSEKTMGFQEAYARNLETLYKLKQVSPRAPGELFERYGIAHFGRYTVDMLESQYRQRGLQRKYGIVVFPYADHSGAFFADKIKLDQLREDLQRNGYALRVVEAGSRSEVAKRILRLDQAYGTSERGEGHKITFAIIGGHGTKESIQFGDAGKRGDEIRLEDISGDRLTHGAKKFFEAGASIVLFSCNTGAKEGIANEMLERYGWKLKAPPEDAGVESIHVSFGKDGQPEFEVNFVSASGEKIETMNYSPEEESDKSI